MPAHESGHSLERTPLERLSETFRSAIETLKNNEVEPDCFTHNAQQIPFGRFGEGRLSTSMTVDEGFVSGKIGFSDENDPASSFYVTRGLGDTSWRQGARKFSNTGVARKLDANWPQQLFDNTAIRHLTHGSAASPSLDDLFTVVEHELAPNARYFNIESIFAYSTISIDPETNTLSSVTLRLESVEDHDGFCHINAQLTIPYECDEVPTSLHSRIESNEMGTMTMQTWYEHPLTKEPVEVTVMSPDLLVEQIIDLTNDLIEEKTVQTNAA